jgi:hypothetical protein
VKRILSKPRGGEGGSFFILVVIEFEVFPHLTGPVYFISPLAVFKSLCGGGCSCSALGYYETGVIISTLPY